MEKKPRNIYQRKRLQTAIVGKSMTQQNLKEETDVNAILKRYSKTGILSHVNEAKAVYGDFTNITSYQDALVYVQTAMSEFMDLPANIRKEFDNDPQQLVAFLQDNKNYDKAVALGLVEAKPSDKIKETKPAVKETPKAENTLPRPE